MLYEIKNFNILTEQNLFFIIFFILTGLVILVFVDIFRLVRKKKGEVPKGLAENELFLRVSEEFSKQLKEATEREIKNNLLDFRKGIERTSQEIIKNYQDQFEKEGGKIKGMFSKISQQIALGVREIEKQIEIFSKKTEEGVVQLSKFNLETQKKISENAENKISQLNNVAKEEVLKIEEKTLEAQEELLNEIKKQSEIFSRELSQIIGQIYQLSEEALKEKIKRAEGEIENYKRERLKEMDQKIYLMLGEIAKKTLGKAIDLSDHEKLVMEALEKAKREIF